MDFTAVDWGGAAAPAGRPLTLLGSSNAAVTSDLRKHAVFHTLKVKAAQSLWARHWASQSAALPAAVFRSRAPAKSVLAKCLKESFGADVAGLADASPSLCRPWVAVLFPGRRARALL